MSCHCWRNPCTLNLTELSPTGVRAVTAGRWTLTWKKYAVANCHSIASATWHTWHFMSWMRGCCCWRARRGTTYLLLRTAKSQEWSRDNFVMLHTVCPVAAWPPRSGQKGGHTQLLCVESEGHFSRLQGPVHRLRVRRLDV